MLGADGRSSVRLWASKHVKKQPLEEFFQFLQCQLRMEVRERLGSDVPLKDPGARNMWDPFEKFVRPNLGKREKWMPFHTVLGAHELYVVRSIQSAEEQLWDSKRRFLVTFIFRAHCRSDFFEEAQLPHLQTEAFWKDPSSQFAPGGAIFQGMLEYRQKTQRPLQTSAFRCIPRRVTTDDDENLVVNIARRTQTLLGVAEEVWPVLGDNAMSASAKFEDICNKLQKGVGLGPTWVKMLVVSIDIAYPKIGLLADRCEVGAGALGGLRRLMPRYEDPKTALERVTMHANRATKSPSVCHFWELLPHVEQLARQTYAKIPLIQEQLQTPSWKLTAVTMQVQLCEWRQFDDYLRKKYKKSDDIGTSPKLDSGHAVRRKPGRPQKQSGKNPGREKKVRSSKMWKRTSIQEFEDLTVETAERCTRVPDKSTDNDEAIARVLAEELIESELDERMQRKRPLDAALGSDQSGIEMPEQVALDVEPSSSSHASPHLPAPQVLQISSNGAAVGPKKTLEAIARESDDTRQLMESATRAAQESLKASTADMESAWSRLRESSAEFEVAAEEVRAAEESVKEAEEQLDQARYLQRAAESTHSNLQAARKGWQDKDARAEAARKGSVSEQFPRHVKVLMGLAHTASSQRKADDAPVVPTDVEELISSTWRQAVSDLGEQISRAANQQTSASRQAKEASERLDVAQDAAQKALHKYAQLHHARLEAERDYRDAQQVARVQESIVKLKHDETTIVSIQGKHLLAVSDMLRQRIA